MSLRTFSQENTCVSLIIKRMMMSYSLAALVSINKIALPSSRIKDSILAEFEKINNMLFASLESVAKDSIFKPRVTVFHYMDGP